MQPPAYFEQVRREADRVWTILESDPDIAGPWRRMFQQVQSPRHVLSELLQNADDSGATWASASVSEGFFEFKHNGRDFTAEEFGSICRFGHSNKRALHTIGFRGVGFKSTFSLGDEVHLATPTLSVVFSKSRFTEPVWKGLSSSGSLTTVRVPLKGSDTHKELDKNLTEWLSSSASLLFFRNIRTLQVNGTELKWVECGEGPCPNSSWHKLEGSDSSPCLLIRSHLEPFPAEAVEEIEAERILPDQEHLEMPPCSVEIVLYGDSRLFVVLPTGVRTKLPFSGNAPFVQDVARLKIKDPDSSPTNRWLLERMGRLAAEAMVTWLGNKDADPEFLAQAYDLMPNVVRTDTSLEGTCAATVESSFDSALEGRRYVLTEANRLVKDGECLEVPPELLDVWSSSELAKILGREATAVASRHISSQNLQKLRDWQAIQSVSREEILERLGSVSPAKPQSWKQLLILWSYLFDDIPAYWSRDNLRGLRVVPVQGEQVLHPASEVVRLGEKRLLKSEDDWKFLFEHLKAYNPNWGRFLAEQRRLAEEDGEAEHATLVSRAYGLQDHLKLSDASDTSQVFGKVAASFFAGGELAVEDCVRLAQIAAHLGVTIDSDFRFLVRSGGLVGSGQCVVADETGRIADMVPDAWADAHLLHEAYWSNWASCTREEWAKWVDSGKAMLAGFPRPVASETIFSSERGLADALRQRGFAGDFQVTNRKPKLKLEDLDFEPTLWAHWRRVASSDERFWAGILANLMWARPSYWADTLEALACQISVKKERRILVRSGIRAAWIQKFRDLPCLVDTRGFVRKPFEVMRRTSATEPLLDVEPFIPSELDTEANRPLLKALGVRDTPTGPTQILERVRALAGAASPPIEELEKWYRRLDSLYLSCTSEQTRTIRDVFEAEPLIFSESHGWVRSQEVFLAASADDVPDTPLIRSSLRDLELWRRIHVAERPNEELILQWLDSLPVGAVLSPDQVRRVKPALARLGIVAWEQCGHWLSLTNEWTPVSQLRFSLSMRSLTRTQELFPAIRKATADFQFLDFDTLGRYPFSDLPSLATCLDERVSEAAVHSFVRRDKPWLAFLARALARIEVPSESEQSRLREAATRLAQTHWRQGPALETIPYLDGVPAGTPRRVPVVWSGHTLYVADASGPQMVAPLAREIGRGFGEEAIGDAIKVCFDREPGFIADYLEHEFKLSPIESHEPGPSVDGKAPQVSPVGLPGEADIPHPEGGDSVSPKVQENTPPQIAGEKPNHDPEAPPERREPNRIEKPSLVERYARKLGLRPDGSSGFTDGNGTRLNRQRGEIFPWEIHQNGGSVIRILPREECLERDPLTVETEVWWSLERTPDTCALLLLDLDDEPVLYPGDEVMRMHEKGTVELYPASYRLVKKA